MLEQLGANVDGYSNASDNCQWTNCVLKIYIMKTFSMQHVYSKESEPEFFDESNAPDWLTSTNTIRGSTMDDRGFWYCHVLQLDINESIKTDFQIITRLT